METNIREYVFGNCNGYTEEYILYIKDGQIYISSDGINWKMDKFRLVDNHNIILQNPIGDLEQKDIYIITPRTDYLDDRSNKTLLFEGSKDTIKTYKVDDLGDSIMVYYKIYIDDLYIVLYRHLNNSDKNIIWFTDEKLADDQFYKVGSIR